MHIAIKKVANGYCLTHDNGNSSFDNYEEYVFQKKSALIKKIKDFLLEEEKKPAASVTPF